MPKENTEQPKAKKTQKAPGKKGPAAKKGPKIQKTQKTKKAPRKKIPRDTPITRDCTVNLHKRIFGTQFKKRAPKAVKAIKEFASKAMHTTDVRLDTRLNKFVWSQGVRNVPFRVRIRLSRKRNDDEDAKEKMYTLVSHVPVTGFKGLLTSKVE